MSSVALDALAAALDAERDALINNDATQLLAANDAKLTALRQIERADSVPQDTERLRELMERNRSNGVLLAQRQRQVRWALRHLGRLDSHSRYQADGRVAGATQRRALGVG